MAQNNRSINHVYLASNDVINYLEYDGQTSLIRGALLQAMLHRTKVVSDRVLEQKLNNAMFIIISEVKYSLLSKILNVDSAI